MDNQLVHIAISREVLESLISRGYVHAVDFRCLNAKAKQTVWQLFLTTLKKNAIDTITV